MDLTPNTTPKGQSCGTCFFALTHTCAEQRKDQVVVRCRRFPPVVGEQTGASHVLHQRPDYSHWPYTVWDDWCGEWKPREIIVAERTRLADEATINRHLRGAAKDVDFDYARRSIPDVIDDLAPGWQYEDVTKDGDPFPTVRLTRYAPYEAV